jgi:hypothetical protein
MPKYRDPGVKMSWKTFIDLAGRECLVLLGWKDGMQFPGPNFDIKKMSSMELRCLVEGHIENELHGTNNVMFSIEKWSDGMYICGIVHASY